MPSFSGGTLSTVSASGARPEALRPDQLARLRVPHDREQVAAEPVRGRLHQAEARVDGDRGVHRAAARLQHVDAGLRRRAAAQHHAVRAQTGERVALPRPVPMKFMAG